MKNKKKRMIINVWYHFLCIYMVLNPKVDTKLFATTANPLRLYHSPRAKIVAFKSYTMQHNSVYIDFWKGWIMKYKRNTITNIHYKGDTKRIAITVHYQ